MNRLSFRIWVVMAVTLAMSTVILILARHISYATSVVGLVMLSMCVVTALGVWGWVIYFILRPGVKVLRSPFFQGSVTVIATAGIASAVIHYLRFIPSPEAAATLSKVIATLLMTAGISVYPLLMWLIWSHIKREE